MAFNATSNITKHSVPLGATVDSLSMATGSLVISEDEISHRDRYDDGSTYVNGDSNQSLLPVVHWKVDEFFFRFMALPSTIRYLEEIAIKVQNNEDASLVPWTVDDISDTTTSVSASINLSSYGGSAGAGSMSQAQISPQLSMISTPTPPAIASPRNSSNRHSKKNIYSPRTSSSNIQNNSKVLSPRRFEEYPSGAFTNGSSPSSNSSATNTSSTTPTAPGPSSSTSPRKSTPSSGGANGASNNSCTSSPLEGINNEAAVTANNNSQSCLTVTNTTSVTVAPTPEVIPPFYFPRGVPSSVADSQQVTSQLRDAFERLENRKANKFNIHSIMRICGLPLYTRVPLLLKCKVSDVHNGHVSADTFITCWRSVIKDAHDVESRFVKILSKSGNDYLVPGDFEIMVQDVVDTHPGLLFLQEAKEFHSRFITTVISRIFYSVNRSWTGRISITEIRNSPLIQTLEQLQHEEDINRMRDYFSYEHFYVIYCKFWDLDLDRDLLVSHADLCKHDSHAVSQKAIDRIFAGTVSKKLTSKNMKMSYSDFVWFLISEEDKQSPTSIEYWFRVMDLDGDGVLSMYELEFFWEEQLQRMIQQDFADLLTFEDILCEMLDLVKPADPCKITLSDLKKCKLTHVFLNTFLNFKKFLEIQQRQNIGFYRDEEDSNFSDWEKYANEEYERLVSEEGDQESYMSYEDDFESALESPKGSVVAASPEETEKGSLEINDPIRMSESPKLNTSVENSVPNLSEKVASSTAEKSSKVDIEKLDLNILKIGHE